MRRLLPVMLVPLVAVLGLAACSPGPAAPATEGGSQKARMDLATKLYAECIATATSDAAVNDDAAGSIADRVMLACKDKRNTLMADVIAFHQIGHPKFSIEQSKAVAEASIATIEDELRRQTVVSIISRQSAGGGATAATATTPSPPAGGPAAPAAAPAPDQGTL